MAKQPAVSDEQIIKTLKRFKNPQTATKIGVPSSRLKQVAGVVQAGTVQTGKPGRPALLFTLAE